MSTYSCSCSCSNSDHVEQLDKQEEDREINECPDEAGEREYEAHTKKYRDAVLDFFSTITGNSRDGQIQFRAWILENHDKLCCKLRHKNLELAENGI